jgi:hypothetical protein
MHVGEAIDRLAGRQVIQKKLSQAASAAQAVAVEVHPQHKRVRICVKNALLAYQLGAGVN